MYTSWIGSSEGGRDPGARGAGRVRQRQRPAVAPGVDLARVARHSRRARPHGRRRRPIAGGRSGLGQLTRAVALSSGLQKADPQPPDTAPRVFLTFTTVSGVNYTAFVVDSTAGTRHIIDPVLVPDTGALPAAGHSRLRIASVAAAVPAIDAYRTQPDSSGLLASVRPLNFRAVTHYFDGAPGGWSVVISHAGMTDTLLSTGSIALADGQARTVVVIDSTAGHVTWRLVPDRN